MSDPGSPPSKKVKLEDEDNANIDKYSNFVTPEELEKLREFKVLDEVKDNEEEDSDGEESDGHSQGLPEDEIEKMLDESLPNEFKVPAAPKEKPYVRHTKIVLEEKGVNPFEILPLDWTTVRHYSGMPIYIHKTTRVCTLSKPYFLGKGNSRRHDIPISAIPCLIYRRALEEEAKQQEIDRRIEEQIKNGTWTRSANTDINRSNEEITKQNLQNNVDENSIETNLVSNVSENKGTNNFVHNINSIDSDNEENSLSNKIKKGAHNDASAHASQISQVNNKELMEQNINNQVKDNNLYCDDKFDSNNEIETDASEVRKCPFNYFSQADSNEDFTQDVTIEESKTSSDKKEDLSQVPLKEKPVILPGGQVTAPPRVESAATSWKTQHLSPEQVTEYCKALFKFKTVSILHFERWADRRKYTKARKALQRPTLPEGTKVITIPAQNNGQDNGGKKRDWVMNMNGRSYLSVFHEYVRRALQQQPVYKFQQLENAASPYEATVYIGDMQYGVGRGSSKRQAKAAAALASIQILIPEMRDHMDGPSPADADFSFFDYVGISDPRIPEFCAAACEPSPHAILRTCLMRNFGACDAHIHSEVKKLEHEQIELTMKVGKHSVTVVCKNKKTAKQRASQAILQALHPQVQSWGSLLRLYGSRSVKSSKERKQEEQEITLLQEQARHNRPNRAVLEKLRADMRALERRDRARQPAGTLLLAPPPACPALALDL